MRAELIPPLLAYHVVGGGAAPVVPWYLAGGVDAANCIAAYQPKGAANLAASYVNIASPGTYNCTAVAEPAWDVATGWAGDNSDNHLNSGVAVASIVSAIIRYSNSLTNTRNDMTGIIDTTPNYYCMGNWAAGFTYYKGGQNKYTTSVHAAGVACISAYKCYFDGTYLDAITAGGTLPQAPNNTWRFLHSGVDPFSGYIQAAALYGAELTAPQVAAITIAMQAL